MANIKRRIVICADGTWNSPNEKYPTNVLKLARAITPVEIDENSNIKATQQVFYDWGIGSYHDQVIAGATGKGIEKNIMDDYRYIVQNYKDGDEIYLFGFSRGAFTIRSLCGLINNCGIIKRDDANLIQKAYDHYKNPKSSYSPSGKKSKEFRKKHSYPSKEVTFVGVWDTVGALGIPVSFLGFFEEKDEFYDTKMGSNIKYARHALAIDEHRKDFEPTIWKENGKTDLKQVWFVGAHSNVGGSYVPDKDGSLLSDIPLLWLVEEAKKLGLKVEDHLKENLHINPLASKHNSRTKFYKLKKKFYRKIDHGKSEILLHSSVKKRWDEDSGYRPKNLQGYVEEFGWSGIVDGD